MSDAWYAEFVDGAALADLRSIAAAQIADVQATLAGEAVPVQTDIAYVSSEQAIQEWIDEERRGPEHDTSTGWAELDLQLGKPLRHSEVILLAARTGVGKTWAIQGMLEHILLDVERSALLIQLEMPAFHMAERLAAHALRLSPGEARRRAADDLTVEQVMAASSRLERLGMVEQALTVQQIPRAIDAMEKHTGKRPTVVALDYMGLLKGTGKSRYEVASDISRQLKEIAKSEEVLLLAAAQLSRDAGDGTKQPVLNDLRDSGVAEEAADRVLGLWRPQPIEDEDDPNIVDGVELGVVVLKNRFGPSGGRSMLEYDRTLKLVERVTDSIPF